MAEQTILYFGYGANRDVKMMQAITGNKGLVGRPGILKGYALGVQRLDQVPNEISETAPAQISPRAILKESWPDTFESYVIKPDSSQIVSGTIWELTLLQRELVRDWELIEFGWYKDMGVQVTTADGQVIEVQTEGLGNGQEVDRLVDGHDYETWLNDSGKFEEVAEKARKEYFERIGQTPEGIIPSKEVK